MVGADKDLGSTLILTANLCATMCTAVKKHMYVGMTITGNDHRAATEMTGDKVACCGDFTLVADEHPGIGEDVAHLALKQCITRINRTVDAVFLDEVVPVRGGIGGAH